MGSLNIDESPKFCQIVKVKALSIIPTIRYIIKFKIMYLIIVDIRCGDLSTPANGEITSCSSGRVGVGYEGDTCSFTCNTGYELTGSETRTCQSDGSWSGRETMCNEGQ